MVTLTLDLNQRTVDKLRERAAQEGKSTDAWVAELLREQVDQDFAQRQKAGIDALKGMLDIADRDYAERGEQIIQEATIGQLPDPQGLRDLDGLLTEAVTDASITDEEVLHQIFRDAHDRPD
jgi:plasmid stability protein